MTREQKLEAALLELVDETRSTRLTVNGLNAWKNANAALSMKGEAEPVDLFRANLRECYEAFTAMRNDINELIGNMISQEATLKDGPTFSAECAAVVEAVRSALVSPVPAITDEQVERALRKAPKFWCDTRNAAKHMRAAIEAALLTTPLKGGTPAEKFAEWVGQGPKLAKAAGCYVGIKISPAKETE